MRNLERMTTKEIESLIGTLSCPSKMPGYGWSIPARRCIIGSILAKKKGSVCNSCYAMKGRYIFPNVIRAMEKRFQAMKRPDWHILLAELIRRKEKKHFRFFDSGDLQSVKMLDDIVQIAKILPGINFWLPSRERKIISEWLSSGKEFPANLTVRISAAMVGQSAGPVPAGCQASTVGANVGYPCPAKTQGNACLDCRACWQKSVESVDYQLH